MAEHETQLCISCSSELPRSHISDPENNPVARIFWGRVPFVFATAFLRFEKGNPAQHIIHQIKYHGDRALAEFMGRMMGYYLVNFPGFGKIDWVVPVPLHRRKERKRGFNQSFLLASGIEKATGKTMLPDLLIRKKYNPSQTRKNRFERWKNVEDIFSVNKNQAPSGNILLIDDVITTGATLEACSLALLKHEQVRVSLCSLAYAS